MGDHIKVDDVGWGACDLGEGEVKCCVICHNMAICHSFCIGILYVCNQMIAYGREVLVTPRTGSRTNSGTLSVCQGYVSVL
jgi:hypothetical protein